MRYSKGHKDEMHQHIVRIASQLFRKEGIEKIGIAVLMEKAGLTVGGFYNHFKSKEDLIKEAILSATDETYCRIFKPANDDRNNGLTMILKNYLGQKHRDAPEMGCVIATLSSELNNCSLATRSVVAEKTEQIVRIIANLLPLTVSKKARNKTANAIWSLMLGTLQASRLAVKKDISNQILKYGIASAIKLATVTGEE